MAKGKYYGPDKNKGVRPTGKDKYYGPNKYKGKVQPKKSGGTTTKTTTKTKVDPLLEQAQDLTHSKYAPVLKELELNSKTNTDLYTSAGNQRRAAVDREIGSISAAGATTRKRISDAGVSAQEAYAKSVAGNTQNTTELIDKVSTANSSMLSNLQAEMKARGMSPEDYNRLSPVTQQMGSNNETLAAMGKSRGNQIEAQAGMDRANTSRLSTFADMQENTAKSGARGAAQANFDQLYTNWLQKKQELDTAKAKTKLEKGDYENQTYLTLKEKAAQAAAERAQQQLQAAISGQKLKLDYAKLGQDSMEFKVNTQYKYDSLSQKQAQKDIENKLKAKGMSLQEAKLVSAELWKQKNFDFDVEKFNWKKNQPVSNSSGLTPEMLALLSDVGRS